eukprot:12663958-Prorocentrum_lima.AAC.1
MDAPPLVWHLLVWQWWSIARCWPAKEGNKQTSAATIASPEVVEYKVRMHGYHQLQPLCR